MKDILLGIILGWLFGLLGPSIQEKILRQYKKNNLRITLISELRDVCGRLIVSYYLIILHLGNCNKESFRWVYDSCVSIQSSYLKNIEDAITGILKCEDKEFNTAMEACRGKENRSLSIKSFSLSFLESNLANLSVFDNRFTADIFKIRAQYNILNEEIENARFFYRLTFDPAAMNTNGDIIRQNLKESYEYVAKRSRIVIDLTKEFIKNNKS